MFRIIAVKIFAAVALVALAVSCSPGEKTVSLRFKFDEGKTSIYSQVTKFSKKIYEADTLAWQGVGESVYEISETVAAILPNGNGEIKTRIDQLQESTNRKDTTLVDTFKVEFGYIMTMNPNGKVLDMRPDSSEGNPIDQDWTEYHKKLFAQAAPQFPEGDIPIGHSWTHTTKVVLPDKVTESSTTYKITSLAREGGTDCAVIEYEGSLIVPVLAKDSDSTKTTGIEYYTTTGVMYFALKEGRIIKQRDRMVIESKLNIEIGDKTTSALVVMEVDMDFKFVRIDK